MDEEQAKHKSSCMPQEKEVVCFAICPAIRKILNHKKVVFYTLKTKEQKAKPTPHTLLDSDVGTKTPVSNKAYLFLLSAPW